MHSQTRFKAGDAHVYEDVAGKSHDTPQHMSEKISHHYVNYGELIDIISLLNFSSTLDYKS